MIQENLSSDFSDRKKFAVPTQWFFSIAVKKHDNKTDFEQKNGNSLKFET